MNVMNIVSAITSYVTYLAREKHKQIYTMLRVSKNYKLQRVNNQFMAYRIRVKSSARFASKIKRKDKEI